MRRAATLLLLVSLTAPAAAQVTAAITPLPALKREVAVATDVVRIGDLIDYAGPAARIPIFRAPDLGQTGALQVARVLDAVRPHGLLLLETRDITEVAVTRLSRAITAKQIEQRIAEALAGQQGLGEAKNLVLTFDRTARTLHVESGVTGELQITRASFDPSTRRFDVVFDLPGSAIASRLQLRYLGSVTDTAEIAVLVRPVARGQVVRTADFLVQRRSKTEIGGPVLAIDTDVVGLAARRDLRAGQLLRAADLMRPEIVQRNETVTLIYEAPGIVVTVRGKALESGADGEPVNVLNLQSKRSVQGVVAGPSRVVVTATTHSTVASVQPSADSEPAVPSNE